MTHRKIITQMLEALELHAKQYPHMQKGYTVDAITAAREYLAAPEQSEPVDKVAAMQRIVDSNTGYVRTTAPKAEPQKNCVKCGDQLMSDLTDTCYTCNQGPEQSEPICYTSINKQGDVCSTLKQRDSWRTVPLYTHPEQGAKT